MQQVDRGRTIIRRRTTRFLIPRKRPPNITVPSITDHRHEPRFTTIPHTKRTTPGRGFVRACTIRNHE